ncbi:MAG: hypothetical protein ACFFFG_04070 [Candidatus Thorarchaeota archaeon]
MDFDSMLNSYCKRFGIIFLGLLPIVLAILLYYQAIIPSDLTDSRWNLLIPDIAGVPSEPGAFIQFIRDMTVVTYLLLIIAAFPFAVNGFMQERAFNEEIKKITGSGLLIEGVEGFDEVDGRIRLLYRGSYSVTITVIISFAVFVSAISLQEISEIGRLFIFTASIGLLAISSGASLLLRLPNKTALHPGGLMRFYSPKSLPIRLDNILTDSILVRLDPITRIHFDEWSQSIVEHLHPKYLPKLDEQTRLERAREKIFLLTYLREFKPELMTDNVFQRELSEIIAPNYLGSLQAGWESGISENTLRVILRDIKDEIPQVFELVQRIFVLVKDNLGLLRKQQEYVSITHPTSVMGNIDPFRILVFVLNLTKRKRMVQIQAQTSMSSLDPDDASQTLLLDEGTLEIPSTDTHLEFTSTTEPVDVLGLVSGILQVGDAISLQFRPNRHGTHVVNVAMSTETEGILSGKSVVITVHRDLVHYFKVLGAKLIGYVGAALSFIGISLGSLSSIFS